MPDQPHILKLVEPQLRIPLERFISARLGREWMVRTSRDLADLACHPAALLSDGNFAVFAKYSDARDGLDQFETELNGLGMLSASPVCACPNRWASFNWKLAASWSWRR